MTVYLGTTISFISLHGGLSVIRMHQYPCIILMYPFVDCFIFCAIRFRAIATTSAIHEISDLHLFRMNKCASINHGMYPCTIFFAYRTVIILDITLFWFVFLFHRHPPSMWLFIFRFKAITNIVILKYLIMPGTFVINLVIGCSVVIYVFIISAVLTGFIGVQFHLYACRTD